MNRVDLHLAKRKITKQLGYYPAFLIPAQKSPAIFRSLVQQTFYAYKYNPLPELFKDKLFVYLSRYCGVSYFTICHSCNLRSQITASEILSLSNIEYPHTEADITADLELLNSRIQEDEGFPLKSKIESSLLRCSSLLFSHSSQLDSCPETLRKFLGTVNYNYLMVFLGYIKLCHQWVEDHPEISHEHDCRSQQHLGSLLLSKIELANFFQTNNTQQPFSAPESIYERQELYLSSQKSPCSTQTNQTLESKSETLKIFTNYLQNLPFPVMICGQSEEILFLNYSWIETTGLSISEISTLSQWREKAQVKIRQPEIANLSSVDPEEQILPVERYSTQLRQIAVETKTTLQRIIDSLVMMTMGIIKNKTTDTSQREISIITQTGKQRFWQLHSATINYDLSGDGLTISMVKDITDIHQANSKLKLISEATQSSTWSWNLESNQIEISPLSYNILGLSSFDSTYENFLSSIHPDERESVDLSIIKTIKAGKDLKLEYRIIKPNQEICWIAINGKLSYDTQGQANQLQGVVTDITRYKLPAQNFRTIVKPRQQKNKVQTFRQLKTILELIPGYLVVVDVSSKTISSINVGLAQSLGFSDTTEAKGKSITDCFPAQYTPQIVWQQQQVLTYGKVLQVQEEVTFVDGIHYFDTIVTPIKNEQGEIEALLHTFNEIPNLAATQEALSQRTIQLEAANRELESFSYSVSHDLQAPLRIINGFSQVLWESCQSELDEQGKHFIARIQANSQKMSDLIDALLELSRVTRSQMKSVQVNLSEMVGDIVSELQTESPERQVKIEITPELEAIGDPQLLRIVLSNLLNNAWKYTSKRSHAQIEFNVLSENERELTYFIRDNGAGFDQDYVDKLFTAFQRLHSQSEFPGTGIGLATVQRIIYRHGGRVWAEGESDRGTTIYFTL